MIIKNIQEFGISQGLLKEGKKGIDFLLPVIKRFLNYLEVPWTDTCCNTTGTTIRGVLTVNNVLPNAAGNVTVAVPAASRFGIEDISSTVARNVNLGGQTLDVFSGNYGPLNTYGNFYVSNDEFGIFTQGNEAAPNQTITSFSTSYGEFTLQTGEGSEKLVQFQLTPTRATLIRSLTGFGSAAKDVVTSVNNTEADNAGNVDLVAIANNFANDAAAAVGLIPIGGLYHTSGVVKIRLT